MRNLTVPRRNPYRLGSLRKGLELMDCFARKETWSLAELAQELGQTKATAFRILHTVEEFGYLHKDTVTGRYSLAPFGIDQRREGALSRLVVHHYADLVTTVTEVVKPFDRRRRRLSVVIHFGFKRVFCVHEPSLSACFLPEQYRSKTRVQ